MKPEHTPFKIIVPDASILVQNAPKFWWLGLRPRPRKFEFSTYLWGGASPDPSLALVTSCFTHRCSGAWHPPLKSHHRVLATRSKHYFRRHRMFDCFVIHTFAIYDYRQPIIPNVVELHMKCIKVTVFKYFQKVAIYIAPNASFLVWNAPNSWASGAPPQTPLGELTALPRPLAGFG